MKNNYLPRLQRDCYVTETGYILTSERKVKNYEKRKVKMFTLKANFILGFGYDKIDLNEVTEGRIHKIIMPFFTIEFGNVYIK